jgi:hypothetical protein
MNILIEKILKFRILFWELFVPKIQFDSSLNSKRCRNDSNQNFKKNFFTFVDLSELGIASVAGFYNGNPFGKVKLQKKNRLQCFFFEEFVKLLCFNLKVCQVSYY